MIYYFQAICCFLWGLRHFSDDQNATRQITDTIVGKVLLASVISRPYNEYRKAGIVLFDTSTGEYLNLNTALIESISKDAEAPQLPAVSPPPKTAMFLIRQCKYIGLTILCSSI
jgi:hypothetical protein